MRKYSFLLLFVLFISGCTDEQGNLNFFSINKDIEFGRHFRDEIASKPEEFPILNKHEYPKAYAHLLRITNKIISSPEIIHRNEFEWEVKIIANDSVLNAFCTPGGYIYVYSGLIKFLDSEDQLAGVLGHEIAHADLRHSTEQLSKSYGIRILIRLIFGSDSFLGGIAGNLAGLTFSRDDETAADLQSVIYLYDTDYDPRGVARFFEKLEANGETMGPLVFLSTHPNPENRVAKIYQEWQKLGSKKGKRFEEEYEMFKASLP